ncbi:hypothetical protein ACU686_42840 [Yinghuangia aomiensis]
MTRPPAPGGGSTGSTGGQSAEDDDVVDAEIVDDERGRKARADRPRTDGRPHDALTCVFNRPVDHVGASA